MPTPTTTGRCSPASATADGLVEGLAAGIAVAAGLIDLAAHEGVHPRVGAADVVPIVRFRAGDPEPARVAQALGERVGRLGSPSSAMRARRRAPARVLPRRRPAGGCAKLAPARSSPVRAAQLHPTAGAVLLGVRPPLVAFNIDLRTDDVEVARAIAAAVRERDGGLPGVQALGLRLAAPAGRRCR